MKTRGFVLSFALFVLALFLLIFAEIQSDQLFSLRQNQNEVWNNMRAIRFAQDVHADLNQLFNQSFRMDQNLTNVRLNWKGTLPSPLNVVSNLLDYQSNIVQLGRDENLSVFLDLNMSAFYGRTDSNLVWQQPFNYRQILIQPDDNQTYPNRVDINVSVEDTYSSVIPWSLEDSGDVYINFNYTDQNTGHAITSQGWIPYDSSVRTYIFVFGGSLVSVGVGEVLSQDMSVIVDNGNIGSLTTHYSIQWDMNADVNATRAGYDVPLTITSQDVNVHEATQWLYA